MKNTKLIMLLFAIVNLVVTSCYSDLSFIEGQGDIVNEYLELDDFHGIIMEGVDDVEISYGEELEVEVVGHENIIPRIQTNVRNGVWTIKLDRGNYRNYNLKYYITMPDLSEISVDGLAKVQVNDFINQGDLLVDIDGAGDVELNRLEGCNEIIVNIDGAGVVSINDETPDLEDLFIYITGAGQFNGYSAETLDCTVDIVGTGKCEVNVIEHLKVFIDGAGTVHYKGEPGITQDITGLGNVVDKN